MSNRRARLLTGCLVLLASALTTLAGCSKPEPAPPAPAPAANVALAADVPADLKIGVLVSVTSAPAEGAQWRDAAEGARVAASRFTQGGASVTLVPANDKGTSQGAVAAIRTLAGQGVAGIVVATSGSHLDDALQEAAAHNLPLLLPYATSTQGLPAHAWLTGPEAATTDQRIVEALQQQSLKRPYLIDAGGGAIAGLTPVASRRFGAGDDPDELARALAKAQRERKIVLDAVVISGPALFQGRLVTALQGAGIDAPVLLSPDALSPAFPESLVKAGGSLSGTFETAGLDEGDAQALQPTAAGRAAAAYFAGLNLLAADPKAPDLFGQQPFSTVAGAADLRSHDAVVALVRAAAAAKSADPAAVAGSLAGLHLGYADGLAGPALDFSAPAASSADDVRALSATAVSPGVRMASPDTPSLYWYPARAS